VDKGQLFFGQSLADTRTLPDTIAATDGRLEHPPPRVTTEGETGTGKSVLARWLDCEGPRAAQPLVTLNCAALAEEIRVELAGLPYPDRPDEQSSFSPELTLNIGALAAREADLPARSGPPAARLPHGIARAKNLKSRRLPRRVLFNATFSDILKAVTRIAP
jgi:hypothetical protein